MSGDPEQEYFADGISEDVTTDLSKIAGLFVIARNSAFAYKGRTPDIRRVCRELGVRYVLEGSVRKAGSRVRINAQMIDGTTGGHVWAERYDRKVEDIFAVQDEVTRAIIDALMVELGDEERVRRDGRGKVDPEAYDCLLRGRECLNRMSAASLAESRAMLLRAIDLDPGLAAAYATLSIVHITEHLNKWNDAGPDHLERALAFARQACEANSHDTHAFYALAHSQMWLRNMDEAERAAQQALDLDPNFAGAFAALGLVRDYTGRHADALGLFEQALKLDPQYGMARPRTLRRCGADLYPPSHPCPPFGHDPRLPGLALWPYRTGGGGAPPVAGSAGDQPRLLGRPHPSVAALPGHRVVRPLCRRPVQGRPARLRPVRARARALAARSLSDFQFRSRQ
jgi:adenylate cyclase